MTTDIQFFFPYSQFSLARRTSLKNFIKTLFKKEKVGLITLNYVFCSDEYLLDINRRFLKHDTYTDIVTFNLTNDKNKVEAEIYISVERVKENAKTLHVSFKNELHRVIFHGALHLCGYKDKLKTEKQTMRELEDHYLALYFQNK